MTPELQGQFRHLLTLAGGALITKGLVDSSALNDIVGIVLALIGMIWSWAHKKQVAEQIDDAHATGASAGYSAGVKASGSSSLPLPLIFLLSAFSFQLLGCTSFTSRQTELSDDGSQRITRVRVITLWDAQNALTKYRAATTDKSQSTTIGGLSELASGTNAIEALKSIDSILGKIAK